eukprot:GEMP01046772.1.p1 GENE.GEMP01046772.1~~GEMP01046772.1.p1  ORF type:complete len:287 (+),score=40.43 GEMP01046772.1:149-1009(+)
MQCQVPQSPQVLIARHECADKACKGQTVGPTAWQSACSPVQFEFPPPAWPPPDWQFACDPDQWLTTCPPGPPPCHPGHACQAPCAVSHLSNTQGAPIPLPVFQPTHEPLNEIYLKYCCHEYDQKLVAEIRMAEVRQESQRARVAAQSAVSEAHIAEAQVLYYRPSRGLSTLAASCPAHFPSPWCPIAPCPPVPPMHAYTKPLIRTPGAINVDNFMQPEIPAGFHRTFPPPCNPPYFPYINPTGPPSPRMDNPIGSTEGRTGRISTQSASGATRTSTGTSGSSGTQY